MCPLWEGPPRWGMLEEAGTLRADWVLKEEKGGGQASTLALTSQSHLGSTPLLTSTAGCCLGPAQDPHLESYLCSQATRWGQLPTQQLYLLWQNIMPAYLGCGRLVGCAAVASGALPCQQLSAEWTPLPAPMPGAAKKVGRWPGLGGALTPASGLAIPPIPPGPFTPGALPALHLFPDEPERNKAPKPAPALTS